jgi:hypothetical protein
MPVRTLSSQGRRVTQWQLTPRAPEFGQATGDVRLGPAPHSASRRQLYANRSCRMSAARNR